MGPEVTNAEAELSRLRTENAQLKLDKEILKKEAAYFVRESRLNTPGFFSLAMSIRWPGVVCC